MAELSQISRPLDLLRLMRAAAAHVGQVEHQVTWARTTSLPASTLSRWTDLLEISYQLVRVPAFSVDRTKRLAKSPKVFWSDPAMALHLAGLADPTGHHLENLVLNDLLPWAWSRSPRPAVMHWRTSSTQEEVDFVVALPSGRLLPIEVKATRSTRTWFWVVWCSTAGPPPTGSVRSWSRHPGGRCSEAARGLRQLTGRQ